MEIGHSFITLAGTGLIIGRVLDLCLARRHAKRMAKLIFVYYNFVENDES